MGASYLVRVTTVNRQLPFFNVSRKTSLVTRSCMIEMDTQNAMFRVYVSCCGINRGGHRASTEHIHKTSTYVATVGPVWTHKPTTEHGYRVIFSATKRGDKRSQ